MAKKSHPYPQKVWIIPRMKTVYRLIAFLLTVLATMANAQSTVYFCEKNGKRLATDVPCEETGSTETRRLLGRESPKEPEIDPIVLAKICRIYQTEKQAILDDQYYRGKPASPARLNDLNARMQKLRCPGC